MDETSGKIACSNQCNSLTLVMLVLGTVAQDRVLKSDQTMTMIMLVLGTITSDSSLQSDRNMIMLVLGRSHHRFHGAYFGNRSA